MKSHRKPGKEKWRGIAVVETAVVLPILLMVTFAAIKYGWILYKRQIVTNAARQIARVAIRSGDRTADIAAMVAAVRTDADGDDMLPGATFSVVPAGGNQAKEGQVVVTVTIPTANVDLITFKWLPTPTDIEAKVTMCKEGP
jgi:Flp pilus assembly protein TadG